MEEQDRSPRIVLPDLSAFVFVEASLNLSFFCVFSLRSKGTNILLCGYAHCVDEPGLQRRTFSLVAGNSNLVLVQYCGTASPHYDKSLASESRVRILQTQIEALRAQLQQAQERVQADRSQNLVAMGGNGQYPSIVSSSSSLPPPPSFSSSLSSSSSSFSLSSPPRSAQEGLQLPQLVEMAPCKDFFEGGSKLLFVVADVAVFGGKPVFASFGTAGNVAVELITVACLLFGSQSLPDLFFCRGAFSNALLHRALRYQKAALYRSRYR